MVYRLDRRVDADHRVTAAIKQALDRSQQDAAQIVGRMIRLQAHGQHARFAERVAATRDVTNLRSRQHQVLVAHQLGRRGRHLGRNARLGRAQPIAIGRLVENPLAKLPDRLAGQGGEGRAIVPLADQPAHFIIGRVDQRLVQKRL